MKKIIKECREIIKGNNGPKQSKEKYVHKGSGSGQGGSDLSTGF
ncbi:unnamed protein product [Meloidogyne enterolobii]|uniref:Uncharacterized protein n=1 Tax=Meloidogyne enterolobii TaxID=390850 RepID=A0ACB1AT92_MELEN